MGIPGKAYRIETPRLVLRCWEPPDAPRLKEAVEANLETLRPWMPWAREEPTDLPAKVDRIRRWRALFDLGQDFVYGVFDRTDGTVLGSTGSHLRGRETVREIGYWIDGAHQRRGLATETAAALTKAAFEIEGAERVEIHCSPRNLASAAVPRKLGFVHEATLRRQLHDAPDGFLDDRMIWTLFPDDYPSTPAAALEIRVWDAMGEPIR